MANPPTSTTTSSRPAQSGPFRGIVIVLLAFIVLVGLAVLIAWLVIKPKQLVYTIDEGSIHNFNITNDRLNSTFDFVITARNPNRRISVYYDFIDISVAYDGQTLAYNTIQPFYQRHRNVTLLNSHLEAQKVAIGSSLSRELRVKKATGEVELELRLKAIIRMKVGAIKLRHHIKRISCFPVKLNFSSSNNFQRAYCDVDD